ncbi:MAG: prolipoprotein diacylglyceryl transferase, partial [Methylobacteriaceae bacterium]|nr:prolipoprotein diacylglyceryl transferase [Methylobacteriaceae bacterium]
MRRILFSWNGLDIYSYPAMLYVGLLVGIFAGAGVAKHLGLNPDRFATALLILLVPALVGSRLFFVLMHWDALRSDLGRIWRRGDGGMAL